MAVDIKLLNTSPFLPPTSYCYSSDCAFVIELLPDDELRRSSKELSTDFKWKSFGTSYLEESM